MLTAPNSIAHLEMFMRNYPKVDLVTAKPLLHLLLHLCLCNESIPTVQMVCLSRFPALRSLKLTQQVSFGCSVLSDLVLVGYPILLQCTVSVATRAHSKQCYVQIVTDSMPRRSRWSCALSCVSAIFRAFRQPWS